MISSFNNLTIIVLINGFPNTINTTYHGWQVVGDLGVTTGYDPRNDTNVNADSDYPFITCDFLL